MSEKERAKGTKKTKKSEKSTEPTTELVEPEEGEVLPTEPEQKVEVLESINSTIIEENVVETSKVDSTEPSSIFNPFTSQITKNLSLEAFLPYYQPLFDFFQYFQIKIQQYYKETHVIDLSENISDPPIEQDEKSKKEQENSPKEDNESTINSNSISASSEKVNTAQIEEISLKSEEILSKSEEKSQEIRDHKNKQDNIQLSSSFSLGGKIAIYSCKGHLLEDFIFKFAQSNGWEYFELDLLPLLSNIINYSTQLEENIDLLLQQKLKTNQALFSKISAVLPTFIVFPLYKYRKILDNLPGVLNSQDQLISEQLFIHKIFKIIRKFYFIANSCLFITISDEETPLPLNFEDVFDINYNFPLPSQEMRQKFFQNLIQEIQDEMVDYAHIALQMKGWSIKDLFRFAEFAKITYEINKIYPDNKTKFNNKFLRELIEEKKFRPTQKISPQNDLETQNKQQNSNAQTSENQLATSINPISEEFERQMFLEAASKYYEDLSITLDKLTKGLILKKTERQILSKYPIIIQMDPKRAMQKLVSAHTRIKKLRNMIE